MFRILKNVVVSTAKFTGKSIATVAHPFVAAGSTFAKEAGLNTAGNSILDLSPRKAANFLAQEARFVADGAKGLVTGIQDTVGIAKASYKAAKEMQANANPKADNKANAGKTAQTGFFPDTLVCDPSLKYAKNTASEAQVL